MWDSVTIADGNCHSHSYCNGHCDGHSDSQWYPDGHAECYSQFHTDYYSQTHADGKATANSKTAPHSSAEAVEFLVPQHQ